MSPYVALSVPWSSSGACSCVDNHVSIGHFVSFQHFQDWYAVVGSSGWSPGLIVCPDRLDSDPVLSAYAGSWALTWGYRMAYNLVQLHSTLCSGRLSFACSRTLTWCVCIFTLGSGYPLLEDLLLGPWACAAAFALGCGRICLCALLSGFLGFPWGLPSTEQLLGNTWSPLFQAFVRRLYSLSLYRSDVCAWLALFC